MERRDISPPMGRIEAREATTRGCHAKSYLASFESHTNEIRSKWDPHPATVAQHNYGSVGSTMVAPSSTLLAAVSQQRPLFTRRCVIAVSVSFVFAPVSPTRPNTHQIQPQPQLQSNPQPAMIMEEEGLRLFPWRKEAEEPK
eukprot:scaffold9348_cov82-Cyclotella_meneghiniana.AAC.1